MSDEEPDFVEEILNSDEAMLEVVAWLREHPEEWRFATVDDELAADPMARRMLDEVYRRAAARRRRRQRWWIAGAGLLVVAGGGVTVAALALTGQPSRPEVGVGCRREARPGGDLVAVGPVDDPVEACRQVWLNEEIWPNGGSIPPLTACIGPFGAIEVYPSGADICDSLGLPPADAELLPESQRVIDLQDRLGLDLNALCPPIDQARQIAQTIVDESGLDGWNVEVAPDSESSTCTIAAIDSSTKTVTLIQR